MNLLVYGDASDKTETGQPLSLVKDIEKIFMVSASQLLMQAIREFWNWSLNIIFPRILNIFSAMDDMGFYMAILFLQESRLMSDRENAVEFVKKVLVDAVRL